MRLNRVSVVLSLLALLAIIGCAQSARHSESTISVRGNMLNAYAAFKDLQPLIHTSAFRDPQNEDRIIRDLSAISSTFHDVSAVRPELTSEPGFTSTLEIVKTLLSDATERFHEGNKNYAQWRLTTLGSYCISCHARFEVPVDFQGDSTPPEGVSPIEHANFLFATRQFNEASEQYLKVARAATDPTERMEALRRWLVIVIRVHPTPQKALHVLTELRSEIKVTSFEDDEIRGWLTGLRRWQNEPASKDTPIRTASRLIARAHEAGDPVELRVDSVTLIRATAVLHRDLEARERKEDRASALFLLAKAYTQLPLFFSSELPEQFLEQCIREFPGTQEARRSFRLYEEIIMLGYTGSGGTRVPADVASRFDELRRLATGIAEMQDRA